MNGVIGVCFHPACYVLPKSLRRPRMQRHEAEQARMRQWKHEQEELKRRTTPVA